MSNSTQQLRDAVFEYLAEEVDPGLPYEVVEALTERCVGEVQRLSRPVTIPTPSDALLSVDDAIRAVESATFTDVTGRLVWRRSALDSLSRARTVIEIAERNEERR